MSDLAPFVAAVLRDDVVTKLLLENARLKEQEKRLTDQLTHVVTITGKCGSPVYATGLLSGQDCKLVWASFPKINQTGCPLHLLSQIEISIGGQTFHAEQHTRLQQPMINTDNGDYYLALIFENKGQERISSASTEPTPKSRAGYLATEFSTENEVVTFRSIQLNVDGSLSVCKLIETFQHYQFEQG
eukprot:scaffold211309_cov59-Attheya_sp.AAC.4